MQVEPHRQAKPVPCIFVLHLGLRWNPSKDALQWSREHRRVLSIAPSYQSADRCSARPDGGHDLIVLPRLPRASIRPER